MHHSLSEEIIPEGPNTPDTPDYTEELIFDSMLEESASQNTSSTRAGDEAYAMMHKKGYENFGIWAWRFVSQADFTSHANEQSVMNHYRVSYSTDYTPNGVHPDNNPGYGWGYDKETVSPFDQQILKYWDLSSFVYQFKGYAPYAGDSKASLTDGNIVINDIQGHIAYKEAYPNTGNSATNATALSNNSIDWVVCQWQRQIKSPIGDKDLLYPESVVPSISYPYARVPLCFHHLLPNVNFVIKYEDGTTRFATIEDFKVVPIQLNGIQTKFPTSATSCTIAETPIGEHMTPVWENPTADGGDPEELRTGFVKHGLTDPSEIHDPTNPHAPIGYAYTHLTPEGGVLMIPNTGTDEGYILDLTLKIHPSGGTTVQTFYGTIGTLSKPVIWESDKKYTYILTITGADVLKLAVNIADWEEGTGGDPILGGGGF